jgi:hemolysin III
MTPPWRSLGKVSLAMRDDAQTSGDPDRSRDLAGGTAQRRPPPQPPAKPRRKPRLRGVSHQVAAFAAVPAVAVLVLRARSGAATAAALVYGVTLVLLFSISAVYHRMHWPLSIRRVIGRIDHAAIFLLIAGTYTPFCLLLGPGPGHRLLAAVWTAAAVGIVVVVWLTGTPKPIRASLYVLLGWFILPSIPAMRAGIGDHALVLLLVGGFFYTLGAAIYAIRRPDPAPEIFGFHEIFHLLVVAAAICHFLVVDAAVRALH